MQHDPRLLRKRSKTSRRKLPGVLHVEEVGELDTLQICSSLPGRLIRAMTLFLCKSLTWTLATYYQVRDSCQDHGCNDYTCLKMQEQGDYTSAPGFDSAHARQQTIPSVKQKQESRKCGNILKPHQGQAT